MTPLLLDYQASGGVAGRVGNRLDRAAPHSAFHCRGEERWCAIAVFSEELLGLAGDESAELVIEGALEQASDGNHHREGVAMLVTGEHRAP